MKDSGRLADGSKTPTNQDFGSSLGTSTSRGEPFSFRENFQWFPEMDGL